jgi:hypothetical protein
MRVVYIVKSFGPENGYVNLKAFAELSDAESFESVVQKQIDDANAQEDEFVEIEEMMVDYG